MSAVIKCNTDGSQRDNLGSAQGWFWVSLDIIKRPFLVLGLGVGVGSAVKTR